MSELAIRRGAAPALAVAGLGYSYPRAAAPSLADVSLQIAPGEFVLLAGRSGSGKSTLLRAACGLVPHFHGGEIAGSVSVAGLDALAAGPGELAAAVGYVAQDPETQIVSTTVAAEIELPLEMRGDAPADRARAVEEVALALAIPHLLGRTVDTLSGGELQRVALAAALVTRPPPGPARRADLAARPGLRRRADLAAAAAERGVGGGGAARRTPARALPRRRRPRRRDGGGRGSASTAPRPSSSPGRSGPSRR